MLAPDDWNLELLMREARFPSCSPRCLSNSSSSSAVVMRLEHGLCRIDAVLSCTGVEFPVPGVDWWMDSAELDLVMSSASSFSNPATMLFALALPTLRVVFGSLLGGSGAWLDLRVAVWELVPIFRGNVAYCRLRGTSMLLPAGTTVDLLMGRLAVD